MVYLTSVPFWSNSLTLLTGYLCATALAWSICFLVIRITKSHLFVRLCSWWNSLWEWLPDQDHTLWLYSKRSIISRIVGYQLFLWMILYWCISYLDLLHWRWFVVCRVFIDKCFWFGLFVHVGQDDRVDQVISHFNSVLSKPVLLMHVQIRPITNSSIQYSVITVSFGIHTWAMIISVVETAWC